MLRFFHSRFLVTFVGIFIICGSLNPLTGVAGELDECAGVSCADEDSSLSVSALMVNLRQAQVPKELSGLVSVCPGETSANECSEDEYRLSRIRFGKSLADKVLAAKIQPDILALNLQKDLGLIQDRLALKEFLRGLQQKDPTYADRLELALAGFQQMSSLYGGGDVKDLKEIYTVLLPKSFANLRKRIQLVRRQLTVVLSEKPDEPTFSEAKQTILELNRLELAIGPYTFEGQRDASTFPVPEVNAERLSRFVNIFNHHVREERRLFAATYQGKVDQAVSNVEAIKMGITIGISVVPGVNVIGGLIIGATFSAGTSCVVQKETTGEVSYRKAAVDGAIGGVAGAGGGIVGVSAEKALAGLAAKLGANSGSNVVTVASFLGREAVSTVATGGLDGGMQAAVRGENIFRGVADGAIEMAKPENLALGMGASVAMRGLAKGVEKVVPKARGKTSTELNSQAGLHGPDPAVTAAAQPKELVGPKAQPEFDASVVRVKVASGELIEVRRADIADAVQKNISNDMNVSATLQLPESIKFTGAEQAKLEALKSELTRIAATGREGAAEVSALVGSITPETLKNIPRDRLIPMLEKRVQKIPQTLMQLEARAIPVQNSWSGAKTKDLAAVRVGRNMGEIEQEFDVLARKASDSGITKQKGTMIHEVDAAFAAPGGIIDRSVLVGSQGIQVSNFSGGEKVFAVGHQGAVQFQGKLSTRGGERYYAILYPKGFVKAFGEDLRTVGVGGISGKTPPAATFAQEYAPRGHAFVVRAENSTRDQGQVHVQFGYQWDRMNINGETMSQTEFMRKQAIGIVEFDVDGKILQIRRFQ